MKKFFLGILIITLTVFACKDDDDGDDTNINTPPPRDRAMQAATDDSILQVYLKTHFYNYEQFEMPSDTFDYQIVIDTIAGTNSSKTPLIDQVTTKKVSFRDVEQNIYILRQREGVGRKSTFIDSTFVTYTGQRIDGEIFDASPNPVWFDLVIAIPGFQKGIAGYGGATEINLGIDGTFNPSNDFGIGAVFIPSGLAYFNSPTEVGQQYANLIFTFSVLAVEESDHDRDNVPSIVEDLNTNSNVIDDDTDGNGTPNFADNDDDGDGIATIDEDLEPDSDLSVDRDGDGDPTNDIGDGDPTNDDTDNDGIPNYLDADSTQSRNDS
ncbi:hypothetical protein NBT05_18340 [Aquimarina sp. ERC-38]|uniref:FKBP-type peptidyl-prolyl cis-trans isomerase n=1 Tax=Aquimarina sp. ERC-38 TaxID=2949996 RepID=UPI002245E540|nr:hypothetical protein [Aquimarina sp. ERC-38]UZO80885.1 hypothetical protein NBT05_18340 [Aquimarina sp. ERC-38]